MQNTNFLKGLLIAQTVLLLIYTVLTLKDHGSDILGLFLSDIQAVNWNGQFNLDFSCYLLLSGLWIMWRNKFATPSLVLALVAAIIGIMLFAPYLLYLIVTEKGNLKNVLLGTR
ncbi:hypothetical protein [Spirosoma panaciterrae]|uniref:hypothetical protein n=1 Tax=Spirosoma panaciterrae TaxID=496058 RepID=UPI0003825B0E|nr:hypothetical protein [Spirosoma panaciterrae]